MKLIINLFSEVKNLIDKLNLKNLKLAKARLGQARMV